MNMGMEIYIAFAGYFQWLHRVFANPFTTWLAILPMGHLFDTTITALNERQKDPDASNDLSAHWFKGLEKAEQDKSRFFNLRCLQAFATANVGAGSDTVSAGLQSFVSVILVRSDCIVFHLFLGVTHVKTKTDFTQLLSSSPSRWME